MRKFNAAGVCIENMHYMVNTSDKINKILIYIENGEYFTINRARQYGKTTTLLNIEKRLNEKYNVLSISFEGIDDQRYEDKRLFIEALFMRFEVIAQNEKFDWLISIIQKYKGINTFDELAKMIREMCKDSEKPVVLMIDEVDKSTNNQLFLNFLGMLRDLYLMRQANKAKTFHSVILSGIYDIKNLKLKYREDERKTYNSPWNIAADFLVDMNFNKNEICTMLDEYELDNKTGMNIEQISESIYEFTTGYPFLVSKMCKIIDERLNKNFTTKGIEDALKILLIENNTLFDDLIKNIQNDEELCNTVYRLIIENDSISYNVHAYSVGIMFGIFKNNNGRLFIHNRIFEIVLYNYMIEKKYLEDVARKLGNYSAQGIYENEDGTLAIEKAIMKYQEYMKSVYGKFDKDFIERQGRLLLLAFFKPIINGKGFYFVESQTGFEQRQDVVITFGGLKYIIELKIWRGEEYHRKSLLQLYGYLQLENAHEGYLIIYDKNDDKEYKSETIRLQNKEIFAVWV